MIDEEKLEDYVETFYDMQEGDYRVTCDSGEDFFQVTVAHLEKEPKLDELVDEIFDTLAMDETRWRRDIEEKGSYSHAYISQETSKLY
ncbi:MAG: hypothetical protein ABEJ36_04770 [Candidatus Nanosalina sp.]